MDWGPGRTKSGAEKHKPHNDIPSVYCANGERMGVELVISQPEQCSLCGRGLGSYAAQNFENLVFHGLVDAPCQNRRPYICQEAPAFPDPRLELDDASQYLGSGELGEPRMEAEIAQTRSEDAME